MMKIVYNRFIPFGRFTALTVLVWLFVKEGVALTARTTQSRENPHAAATGDRRRLSAGYGGGTPPVRGFRMVDAGGRSGALIDLRPFGRNRSSPAALQPRLREQLF